jgi:RNA polymerase sigma-70 factor (ECF subfamily)
MATPTDAELLRSADPELFGEFYDRHRPVVLAYIGRRVRRPDLAVDVAAEVFARALQRRADYDPARGPAIAWLLTIARNLLIDAARRGRVADAARRRLTMEPIVVDDAGLARVEADAGIDVRAALASLPPDVREAVLARVVAEEPYGLLAERVGVSQQVIRKRVSRGLAALRRSLEDHA